MMIQKGESIKIEEAVGNIAPIIGSSAQRIAENYKRTKDLVVEVEDSPDLMLNHADIIAFILN